MRSSKAEKDTAESESVKAYIVYAICLSSRYYQFFGGPKMDAIPSFLMPSIACVLKKTRYLNTMHQTLMPLNHYHREYSSFFLSCVSLLTTQTFI